jgi:hypothetical protein
MVRRVHTRTSWADAGGTGCNRGLRTLPARLPISGLIRPLPPQRGGAAVSLRPRTHAPPRTHTAPPSLPQPVFCPSILFCHRPLLIFAYHA